MKRGIKDTLFGLVALLSLGSCNDDLFYEGELNSMPGYTVEGQFSNNADLSDISYTFKLYIRDSVGYSGLDIIYNRSNFSSNLSLPYLVSYNLQKEDSLLSNLSPLTLKYLIKETYDSALVNQTREDLAKSLK